MTLISAQQAFSKYTAMKKYSEMSGIEKKGAEYSSRERPCEKCDLHTPGRFCIHLDACHYAFIRGFVKGDKYRRKLAKSKSK